MQKRVKTRTTTSALWSLNWTFLESSRRFLDNRASLSLQLAIEPATTTTTTSALSFPISTASQVQVASPNMAPSITSRQQVIIVVTISALAVLLSSPSLTVARDTRQEEQTCHLRELDLCLASVAVFTQSTNAHPVNNAEVNRQCKILLETETCLYNYTNRCMSDMQGQMVRLVADGGLDTIRDLCKPHSKLRSSYLKHGDCINNQHKGQRVCMRDFQVSLEKAADIEWQDRLKLACCAFNKLHACVRDVVEPKCGNEAYELHSQLFRASFSRMPSLVCSKYDHAGKACGQLLPPAGSQPKGAKSHSVLSRLMSSYTGSR